MAVRADTFVFDENGQLNITWAGLLNTDSGVAVSLPGKVWKMVAQAVGTFGAAGSVTIQGSNDNVNWFALKDIANVAVAMTTVENARIEAVPRFLRPLVTAGDGTTNLTVIIHAVP